MTPDSGDRFVARLAASSLDRRGALARLLRQPRKRPGGGEAAALCEPSPKPHLRDGGAVVAIE